jgi:hypothetical protein
MGGLSGGWIMRTIADRWASALQRWTHAENAVHKGSLLPKIISGEAWAGRRLQTHECVVCGVCIEIGDLEYEVWVDGSAFSVHRPCFRLWQAADDDDVG